ncbi:MAG: metallopeptidase family protein [Candidatus Eisenbacteria bacterium]|nr:metallopeptidase family protein [Candidatus Eisenbacteria bacterium]
MEKSVDDWIEAIEGELDEGDPERALDLSDEALRAYPDVADLLALQGDALWSLGDVRGANERYSRAVELLPDAPDLLAGLSRIRFSLCDFFSARRFAKEALRFEERVEAIDVLSRLAERGGRLDEADRMAERANWIDPEAYVLPYRIGDEDFQEAVEEAIHKLPAKFRREIESRNVAILVERVPAEEILLEDEPPFDPAILGLYSGIPLPERTSDSQSMPDTIHLFQGNIERVAADREELIREIAITVYHELGHFFGLDEDDLEELELS